MQNAPLNLSDLDTFFNVSEFGIEAELAGVPVQGIFDNSYSALGELDIKFESRTPQFLMKEADAPNVDHGDSLVVGARTYQVVEIQPDGTGLQLLILAY